MKSDSFQGLVQDQLREIPELLFRRMFGGYGIYSGTSFFGLIHKERLYFRTDDETQKRYENHGTSYFIAPGSKKPLKRYFEVPLSVIEDKKELLEWAREAIKTVPGD